MNHLNWHKVNWYEVYSNFKAKQGLTDGRQACPCTTYHTNKSTSEDFKLELSAKTTMDGFRFIGGSCWHESCKPALRSYLSELNKQWWRYVYVHNEECLLTEQDRMEIAQRAKESISALEAKLAQKYKHLTQIQRVFGNLSNETIPNPVTNNHTEETCLHLSLFREGEIIFMGQAMDSGNGLLSLSRENVVKAFASRPINFVGTSVYQTLAARKQENILEQKYIVLEMDKEPSKQVQWNRLLAISRQITPLLLCVDSGGKSLHGWFDYKAIEPHKTMLGMAGYDTKTMSPQQPVRLAGCYRKEKQTWQTLLYKL